MTPLLLSVMFATAPATDASVLAFNVLYDAEDVDASVDVIAEADPDLVCLTELTSKFVKAFERRLGARYPHRVFAPTRGTWGVGIASRTPLSDARTFEEKPHRIPAMEAVTRLRGKEIRLVCVHLFPPVGKHRASDGFFTTLDKNAALRVEQAKYLIGRYSGEPGPVLIAGDMNEGRSDDALLTLFKAGYRHACAIEDEDCGATFPGATYFLPAVFEIDHILGRGVTFTYARVIDEGGSDHYPVAAAFRLDASRSPALDLARSSP